MIINKKKVLFGGLIGAISLISVACGTVPEPGETVLKVDKLGDNAGFDKAQIVTGSYGNELNVVYYKISNRISNYVYTASLNEGKQIDESILFRTSDGFETRVDVGISYIIRDPKKFLKEQRMEDEYLVSGPLYILLRQKINAIGNTYMLSDLITIPGQNNKGSNTAKTLADFQDNLLKQLNKETERYGVEVLSTNFITGFKPPKEIAEKVLAAQQLQIEAQQQASLASSKTIQYKNELETANAELQLARIKAETRKLDSVGVTPEFVTLQVIALLKEKWNGSFVIISGK